MYPPMKRKENQAKTTTTKTREEKEARMDWPLAAPWKCMYFKHKPTWFGKLEVPCNGLGTQGIIECRSFLAHKVILKIYSGCEILDWYFK